MNKPEKSDKSDEDSLFGSSSSTNENEKRRIEERRKAREQKRLAKLQEIEIKKSCINQ